MSNNKEQTNISKTKDDIKKDDINIYYWGKGFDKSGIEEFFNLDYKQSHNYIKEYIQQYYDKEIILC